MTCSVWKEVEATRGTGLLDKNGVEIRIGDTVTFRRKVRRVPSWNRQTNSYDGVPGFRKNVTLQVEEAVRIMKKRRIGLFYKDVVVQIEYLRVREKGKNYKFPIYRTENLTVINEK